MKSVDLHLLFVCTHDKFVELEGLLGRLRQMLQMTTRMTPSPATKAVPTMQNPWAAAPPPGSEASPTNFGDLYFDRLKPVVCWARHKTVWAWNIRPTLHVLMLDEIIQDWLPTAFVVLFRRAIGKPMGSCSCGHASRPHSFI
jgi:hypothetical protein